MRNKLVSFSAELPGPNFRVPNRLPRRDEGAPPGRPAAPSAASGGAATPAEGRSGDPAQLQSALEKLDQHWGARAQHVVCEWGCVFVITNANMLIMLRECDTRTKLKLLFKKKLFAIAISLAHSRCGAASAPLPLLARLRATLLQQLRLCQHHGHFPRVWRPFVRQGRL